MIEFLNQDFLFFILFFILSFHSPPHTCPLSRFFYFFFSSRTFQQHHLLFSSEKRERQRQREEKDWGISVHHAVRDRGSPCCQRSRSTMHYHVRHPTAARPSSHHQARSDRHVLFFSLFNFFLIFLIFYFLYLLVLIQLYFIRIGICFVFCVWIM